jgi:hypothetical protein
MRVPWLVFCTLKGRKLFHVTMLSQSDIILGWLIGLNTALTKIHDSLILWEVFYRHELCKTCTSELRVI